MIKPSLILGGAIACASGAVALGHELLWTRRLVDLLGGSSESNTRVLSLFFLGLSLGAIAARRILARSGNRMLWLGFAELLVGLTTIPVIFLSNLTDSLWPSLGPEWLESFGGLFIKFSISVLVVLPPSVAMGTTLPLLFSALLHRPGELGRQGILIYAINTAGGLFGLLAIVAVILPFLGAFGSMVLLSTINVGLGLICIVLSTRREFQSERTQAPKIGTIGTPGFAPSRIPITLAFLSGFGLLASEIIILQTIMLVVPLSYHGPAAVLGTVVALLAVAAPIAARIASKDDTAVKEWLPIVLWGIGISAVLSPFWYLTVVSSVQLGTASHIALFTGKVGLLVLGTFGILLLMQGVLFPMCMVLFEKERGESTQDGAWSRLLFANGVGGLLGAEFAYRGLLPAFGVHVSLGVIGLIFLVVSAWLTKQWFPKAGLRIISLVFGILLITIWGTRLPHMNPNLPFTILRESIGADGLVAVIEGEGPGRAIVVSNQYILGSSSGQFNQARQAHIPLLLHPAPRTVGFIGLATGITPGGAVQHSNLEEIVVAEISKGVIRAARDYFDPYNEGLFQDSRTRVFAADGRILVSANPNRFDVLVGDLFLPWGAGASRLYSVEHFQSARDSLRVGGLFCQWLPMYQLTEPQFERILGTFQRVFPTTYLFRNSASPLNPSIGLVGFREGDLSWDVVKMRCADLMADGRVTDPGMLHWESVAMHYLGAAAPTQQEDDPITLNNLWLEIDASREQITGAPQGRYLAEERWIRFLSNQIPAISRVDVDDAGYAWHRLGIAISKWEWDFYENMILKRGDRRLVEDDRVELLEKIPKPIVDSVMRNPKAWAGSIELFR